MPDPVTRQPLVRNKLAEYLTNETIQFFPDIDWLYYEQEHNSTMSPRGSIFIEQQLADQRYPGNLENLDTMHRIHVVLKISKDSFLDLLDSMDNWAAQLKNETFKQLQTEGYEGLFKGIHLNPQGGVQFRQERNQDDGGTGELHFFLDWEDHGIIAQARVALTTKII